MYLDNLQPSASSKNIRAKLHYSPPTPSVTITSSHTFLTDKFNPPSVSPSSFTRAILNENVSPRKKRATDITSHEISEPMPMNVAFHASGPSGVTDHLGICDATLTENSRERVSGPLIPVKTVSAELILPPTPLPKHHVAFEDLRTNFNQMKEERDQCSKDLIDYLSKSLGNSNPAQPFNDADQVDPVPVEQPPQTEPILSNPPSQLTAPNKAASKMPVKKICVQPKPRAPSVPFLPQPYSGINVAPRNVSPRNSVKNVETPRTNTPNKAPAHDSVRAKKFMIEQQRKRKQDNKKSTQMSGLDAIERKRRLAELHRNSQRILQNNLKKVKQPKEGVGTSNYKKESDVGISVRTGNEDDHPTTRTGKFT